MFQIVSKRSGVTLTVLSLSASLFVGCADDASGQPFSDEGEEAAEALAQEDEASSAAEPRWKQREDLGKGDGSDVVTIGDSWMVGALGGAGIAAALRDVGGVRYRNYGRTATQLSTGAIPGQFARALRANKDIKTVIMTGGGNDVLIGSSDCSTAANCAKAGERIAKMLNDLWTDMSNAGVKDVVYIQYSNNTTGSRGRDAQADAPPPVIPICQTGPIICHSIPTTDIISRRDLSDGIHPNRAGNRRIAERVLKVMEERGIRR